MPSSDKPDWWARAFGLIGIIGAAVTFFYTNYYPANVSVAGAPYILVQATPQIGGWFTLANEGAQQVTITSASLDWDGTSMKCFLTSPNLDQWEYSGKGKRIVTKQITFTLFAPIGLKARDQSNAALWFRAEHLSLQVGHHDLLLTLYNGGKEISVTKFSINMDETNAKNLRDDSTSQFLVPVISQERVK